MIIVSDKQKIEVDIEIDPRLESGSFFLCDWPLSKLYFKNEARFPWFVLVPRVMSVTELMDLSSYHQKILIEEITMLQRLMMEIFKPMKLNVGQLGNIVRQLHIHVVGRSEIDEYWPYGIWQKEYQPRSYLQEQGDKIRKTLEIKAEEVRKDLLHFL